jgi:hypothetical protein
MLIVYIKIILYIGYNYYFYISIRANDFREDIIGLNSNIKLFRDADLYTIRYTGVRLKKAARIGINTSVYLNSLFLKLIILVYGLNVVRAIYNIFSARNCLHSWTPTSYILSIELSHYKF